MNAVVDWQHEWKPLGLVVGVFLAAYHLPVDALPLSGASLEALALTRWYAREHVLLCLVPAFYIAGAISVFVRQQAVLRYLGPKAPKPVAYGVASVSGSVLAVCSCTVLPLFGGIYQSGAGLGPASAFLYAGPAINVLAVILTARILGPELGIARAVGAVVFAVVIGLLMSRMFRREEEDRERHWAEAPEEEDGRPLWQTGVFFAAMVGVLVFANWGRPEATVGLWASIFALKWKFTALFAALTGVALWRWMGMCGAHVLTVALGTAALAVSSPSNPEIPFAGGVVLLSLYAGSADGELGAWFQASWDFAKQILPLLLAGILVAGFLLGRPGQEGIIPAAWVAEAVGGNSLGANLFASVAGAFMYFATLTEVPILEGLLGSGMGQGPALALLLAGPALSLPSILVIRSIMGWGKTAAFIVLVVVMATTTGLLYGMWA
jgi:uncharacterized membrane protein YraQ (UPF0718 family)